MLERHEGYPGTRAAGDAGIGRLEAAVARGKWPERAPVVDGRSRRRAPDRVPEGPGSEDAAGVEAGSTGAAAARDQAQGLRRELAAQHADAFGFALACCRWDRPEAEDVVQSTYLKVLDGRARFGARSSFRTWLFGVVRRTAAERRRGQWRRIAAWRRSADPESFATPDFASHADAARLRRELSALPARQREVLHLVFYGDLSIAAAAEVMGVALGTARAHYERGKRRLRERLDVEETA